MKLSCKNKEMNNKTDPRSDQALATNINLQGCTRHVSGLYKKPWCQKDKQLNLINE